MCWLMQLCITFLWSNETFSWAYSEFHLIFRLTESQTLIRFYLIIVQKLDYFLKHLVRYGVHRSLHCCDTPVLARPTRWSKTSRLPDCRNSIGCIFLAAFMYCPSREDSARSQWILVLVDDNGRGTRDTTFRLGSIPELLLWS